MKVKETIGFISGILLGAGLGALVTKKKYEKIINQINANVSILENLLVDGKEKILSDDDLCEPETVARVQESLAKTTVRNLFDDNDIKYEKSTDPEVKKRLNKLSGDMVFDSMDGYPSVSEYAEGPTEEFSKLINKPDPDKLLGSLEIEDDEYLKGLEEAKNINPSIIMNEDIMIIEKSDYASDEDNMEKEELNYYDGDGILSNLVGDILDQQENYIGEDALSHFGYLSHNNNVVYIRNLNLGIDFKVTRIFETYF